MMRVDLYDGSGCEGDPLDGYDEPFPEFDVCSMGSVTECVSPGVIRSSYYETEDCSGPPPECEEFEFCVYEITNGECWDAEGMSIMYTWEGTDCDSVFFEITDGIEYCETDDNGCFSDGPGEYGAEQACVVEILEDSVLEIQEFSLEQGDNGSCNDAIQIDGVSYCGSLESNEDLNGMAVAAGQTITFTTNAIDHGEGFTICFLPPPPMISNTTTMVEDTCSETTRSCNNEALSTING